MSASMNTDPDLAVLREDLDALKRDVASLIEHMQRRRDEHGSERRRPG